MRVGSEARAEQRLFPRYDYQVDVGILGYHPRSGVTVDISRGGVKVTIDEPVDNTARGETCLVRFLNAGAELRPHSALGIVRRVETDEEHCVLGIQFVTPLEVLKVADEASGSEVSSS